MTGPDLPAVRVGIVSWNTAEVLDRCLACLPAALDGLDAEIVVVDNASDDGSPDVAASAPGVTLVRSPRNVGYAPAMNRALHVEGADGPPVLVALNPDTEPPPGSLRALVEAIVEHPHVAVAGPRLIGTDGGTQHSAYRFPSLRLAAASNLVPRPLQRGRFAERWWLHDRADHARRVEVDWLTGAVHVIRRAAVPGPGVYRERWGTYVEDLDLCWRVRQGGWAVLLVGEVTVPHVGNVAGAQAFGRDRTRRWLDATYDWYAGELGPWQVRLFALLNLLGSAAMGASAALGAVLGGRSRGRARMLLRTLPTHLRVVLAGPRDYGRPTRTTEPPRWT